jgi:hypothetical protein
VVSTLRVLGREVWELIRQIEWKVEPAPEPISDGGTAEDRDIPHATFEGDPDPDATDPLRGKG